MPPDAKLPTYIKDFIPNGQKYITNIRRHIIGLIYIYLIILVAVAALVMLAVMTTPDLRESISGDGFSMLSIAVILSIALVILILVLVTNIYMHNRMIITDKEIIQVLQKGVFQVKSSHLSHEDIEDVTSEQNGLLQTIFNYGTLNIETSGELKNFVFSYCPDPSRYARIVLEARHASNGN